MSNAIVPNDQTPNHVAQQLNQRIGRIVEVINGKNPRTMSEDPLQRISHPIKELVSHPLRVVLLLSQRRTAPPPNSADTSSPSASPIVAQWRRPPQTNPHPRHACLMHRNPHQPRVMQSHSHHACLPTPLLLLSSRLHHPSGSKHPPHRGLVHRIVPTHQRGSTPHSLMICAPLCLFVQVDRGSWALWKRFRGDF